MLAVYFRFKETNWYGLAAGLTKEELFSAIDYHGDPFEAEVMDIGSGGASVLVQFDEPLVDDVDADNVDDEPIVVDFETPLTGEPLSGEWVQGSFFFSEKRVIEWHMDYIKVMKRRMWHEWHMDYIKVMKGRRHERKRTQGGNKAASGKGGQETADGAILRRPDAVQGRNGRGGQVGIRSGTIKGSKGGSKWQASGAKERNHAVGKYGLTH